MKTMIRVDQVAQEIYLYDLTDEYNQPAGFNRGVQGIKKAFALINEKLGEFQDMSMYRVIDELEKVAPKLRFHTYCRMD